MTPTPAARPAPLSAALAQNWAHSYTAPMIVRPKLRPGIASC
mgnify:CR=1 FL=1